MNGFSFSIFQRGLSLAFLFVAALPVPLPAETSEPVYLDRARPLEARLEDLLSRLTLEEKISLVHADSKFTTPAVPRLGIPRRWLSDGPHGVREDIGPDTWAPAGRTDDYATWMPALIGLASTWNPELARACGEAIGEEARARGKQILLGPGLNIMRTPLCGRNFEYMGEDPFLTARIAVGYIEGVQSQEVSSCAKHFAANNQEDQRMTIDVEMDDRTLHEIYLPAFKAAVREAGVLSVMAAYNRFRGQPCSANELLLHRILKEDWKFPGLVMSDWGAVHDTRDTVLHGLDLEMGSEDRPYNAFYLADPFLAGLRSGIYPMSLLDDKVRRNLRVMFATHAIDGRAPGALNTSEHHATALHIAEESLVLLKNDGEALPLDPAGFHSIAVIGDNAVRRFAHDGGSAGIKALYEVTPLEGILRACSESPVGRAGGATPLPLGASDERIDIRKERATTGEGCRTPERPAGDSEQALRRVGTGVNVSWSAGYGAKIGADAVAGAVAAAKRADVAIVFAGLTHDEGFDAEGTDRKDMKLPYGQDELIAQVVRANPRTIVVLVSGSPVEMAPWVAKVPAILEAWYPGMEGGNAVAAALFGDVNPSGKLPCTFPKRLADSPAHAANDLRVYPGKDGLVHYDEGLFVGYRWFDAKKIAPLFPFGHGLSYTRFAYADLKLVEGAEANGPLLTVQGRVTNTGVRAGAEVVQLYVHQARPGLPRPEQELKGFRKVFLKPGETAEVSLSLDRTAFAYYDPAKAAWVADPDAFTISLGSSSRDIRLKGTWRLKQEIVFHD